VVHKVFALSDAFFHICPYFYTTYFTSVCNCLLMFTRPMLKQMGYSSRRPHQVPVLSA